MVDILISICISTMLFFGHCKIDSTNNGDFSFSRENETFELLVSRLDKDILYLIGSNFERMKHIEENRKIAFCFYKKAGDKGNILALSHLSRFFTGRGGNNLVQSRSRRLYYLYLARDKANIASESECSTLLKDLIGIEIYMLENGMEKINIGGDKLH